MRNPKETFMKKLILTTMLTLSSTTIFANAYNTEIDASYTTRDTGASKAKSSLLDASYYFGGVDDTKGPLAEAAFLNHVSEINIKYGISDVPNTNAYTTYGFGGRYVTESSRIILSFDYLNNGLTYESQTERIVDGGTIGFGAYLGDAATLVLKFSSNQNKNETTGEEIDSSILSLNYKQLFTLGNEDSINLYARYGQTNYEEDIYNDYGSILLGADYYFNQQFSVGLNLDAFRTQADDKAQRYGIESTYFFDSRFSIYGSYSMTNIENSEDLEAIRVGVQARF